MPLERSMFPVACFGLLPGSSAWVIDAFSEESFWKKDSPRHANSCQLFKIKLKGVWFCFYFVFCIIAWMSWLQVLEICLLIDVSFIIPSDKIQSKDCHSIFTLRQISFSFFHFPFWRNASILLLTLWWREGGSGGEWGGKRVSIIAIYCCNCNRTRQGRV